MIDLGEINMTVNVTGQGPTPGFYCHPKIPAEVYYLETIDRLTHVEYRWHLWIVGSTGTPLQVPLSEMARLMPHLQLLGFDRGEDAEPAAKLEVRDLTPAGIFRGLAVYFDQSSGTISWQDSTLAQMMAEEATKLEREATQRYELQERRHIGERGTRWGIVDTKAQQFAPFGSGKPQAQRVMLAIVSGQRDRTDGVRWDGLGDWEPLEAQAEPVWPFNVQRRQRVKRTPADHPVWGVWDAERDLFAPCLSLGAAHHAEQEMPGMTDPRRRLDWEAGWEPVPEDEPVKDEPTPNPRYLVTYRARQEGGKYHPGVYDEATSQFYSTSSDHMAERIRDELEVGNAIVNDIPRHRMSAPGEWPFSEVERADRGAE